MFCLNGGGSSKKETVPAILGEHNSVKLLCGWNMPYFPGFGDLQSYEAKKLRICSESAFRVFPDLVPEMLNRTQSTFNS